MTEDEDTPLERPRLERVGLVGATSADRIRASGHACRIKQAGHMAAPDRYNVRSEITSCEVGVVHTWPFEVIMARLQDFQQENVAAFCDKWSG